MLAGVRSFAHQARFQANSPSNLRKAEQLFFDQPSWGFYQDTMAHKFAKLGG
jgi:hypothetical protein